MPNNLKDALEKRISTQYEPEVFPCSSTISQKIKKKADRSLPQTASVEDKQARAMLDLTGSHLVFSFHGNYD